MKDPSSILTDPDSSDSDVLDAVASAFSLFLGEAEKPNKWLSERDLLNEQTFEELGVGFAERRFGKLIPTRDGKLGTSIRDRLVRLGVSRENGRWHLAGSLTFPVLDASGCVSAIFGRRLGPGLPASIDKSPFAGDRNAFWGVCDLSKPSFAGTLVICSSMEDVLACRINGMTGVTWVRDAEHFDAIVPLILEAGVRRLLYPGGEPFFAPVGVDTIRVHVPYGIGIWHYLKKSEFPKASLKELLNLQLNLLPPLEPEPEVEPVSDGVVAENGEIRFSFADRRYRVRGLEIDESWSSLKVNLRIDAGDRCHVDLVDFYSFKQRRKFVEDAAAETGEDDTTIKSDLGRILMRLEELRENLAEGTEGVENGAGMSEEERCEAMELLTDPNLLDRIVEDFRTCGLVGEDANALFGYVAAVSRKLDDPISVIIQSSSSAGKSALMEAIVEFIPPEERMHLTAMTAQSLYYVGRDALKHKTVSISESEGMQRADYALKLLQSEKRLSIASTGRDSKTGRLTTQHYEVEGPVQTIVTTTAGEIDEELQNRSVVLTVGEGREQTRAIQCNQRRGHTLEGILSGMQRDATIRRHRNAQRLLRSIMVVNPFAAQLTFDDSRVRHRRDHAKYLNLIRTITFLHQHRRRALSLRRNDETIEYLETTEEDVRAANELMAAVLANSVDELTPPTRKLLDMVRELAERIAEESDLPIADVRMTRRRIREFSGWNDTRLRKHLGRLAAMEYLLVHRRGKRFVEYEILPDCEAVGMIELSVPSPSKDDSRTLSHPMSTPFAPPEGANATN